MTSWMWWTRIKKELRIVITLMTKVCIVKAKVFPVVMYGWMWELVLKEGWVLKNWCFQIVVLEKTLESPVDCKEIKLVNPKGNCPENIHWKDWCWSWNSKLWPPDMKSWLTGKDPDAGKDWRREKGTTEDEMLRWHHWPNGHEFA